VTTTTIVVVVKQLKIERTGGVIKPADANGWSGRTKGENGRGWWEKENKRERERVREREAPHRLSRRARPLREI